MRPDLQRIVAHLLEDPALVGCRVAIIGDFHVAPWRSTRALRWSVDAINASQPDLIALVGDFGYSFDGIPSLSRTCYRAVMPRLVRELARLRARHGICAVLGNHDMDAGSDYVAHALATVGINVLRNSHYDVLHNGARLRVFGVDDIKHRDPGPGVLRDQLLACASAVLVLSHHPDIVLQNEGLPLWSPVLVASGHTHGGQIAFPWLGAPVTLSRAATRLFPAGFVPNDGAALYITRGLGEQIPLRVRASREVTLVDLALR